jgi:thioredoxin-like negative regulator of GroEL
MRKALLTLFCFSILIAVWQFGNIDRVLLGSILLFLLAATIVRVLALFRKPTTSQRDALTQAAEYEGKQRYLEAILILKRAAKSAPVQSEAQLSLASLYIRTNRPRAARKVLDALLRESPGHEQAQALRECL